MLMLGCNDGGTIPEILTHPVFGCPMYVPHLPLNHLAPAPVSLSERVTGSYDRSPANYSLSRSGLQCAVDPGVAQDGERDISGGIR